MQTSAKTGSSDTEVKLFTVMPWSRTPNRAVTTVTPVANRPTTYRYAIGSTPAGSLARAAPSLMRRAVRAGPTALPIPAR